MFDRTTKLYTVDKTVYENLVSLLWEHRVRLTMKRILETTIPAMRVELSTRLTFIN